MCVGAWGKAYWFGMVRLHILAIQSCVAKCKVMGSAGLFEDFRGSLARLYILDLGYRYLGSGFKVQGVGCL